MASKKSFSFGNYIGNLVVVKVLRLGEREVRWAAILGVSEDVLHWVIHGLTVCLLQREGIFSSPQGSADMHFSRWFVCICFLFPTPHSVFTLKTEINIHLL